MGVPGEEKYLNKGVAFCPHCDGPLFKGKRIAVIGGGNSGVEAAIDLAGLPPNMMHLQHFHGFPDGKAASCPTGAADTNGDGYIDLVETEPFAGTTMMPFHAHPVTLEIANDSYPVADKNGVSHYTDTVSVADLDAALKAKFKAPSLALDKRVIFIHGVANSPALPASVKSLPGVPANVTIPIACGKIEAVK